MNLATNDFAGSTGFDVSAKLNPKLLANLLAGQVLGHKPAFIIRYVFFGPALACDIDGQELEMILSSGAGLLLVQHPRLPKNNKLNESTGASDAEWAIKNAIAAGYDPSKVRAGCKPPVLFLDMEGLANPGPQSQAHAVRWVNDVRAAGYRPGVYFGFDCGVSDLSALGDFCAFCDFAPFSTRPKPPNGWDVKQSPQVTMCGIGLDPDTAFTPPQSMVGMVDGDLFPDPGDPLPHHDEVETKTV